VVKNRSRVRGTGANLGRTQSVSERCAGLARVFLIGSSQNDVCKLAHVPC